MSVESEKPRKRKGKIDLERLKQLKDEGKSYSQIAEELGVTRRGVIRVIGKARRTEQKQALENSPISTNVEGEGLLDEPRPRPEKIEPPKHQTASACPKCGSPLSDAMLNTNLGRVKGYLCENCGAVYEDD